MYADAYFSTSVFASACTRIRVCVSPAVARLRKVFFDQYCTGSLDFGHIMRFSRDEQSRRSVVLCPTRNYRVRQITEICRTHVVNMSDKFCSWLKLVGAVILLYSKHFALDFWLITFYFSVFFIPFNEDPCLLLMNYKTTELHKYICCCVPSCYILLYIPYTSIRNMAREKVCHTHKNSDPLTPLWLGTRLPI